MHCHSAAGLHAWVLTQVFLSRDRRWRNFLSPDIEHPRKSPFTEWEIAVVVLVRETRAMAAGLQQQSNRSRHDCSCDRPHQLLPSVPSATGCSSNLQLATGNSHS